MVTGLFRGCWLHDNGVAQGMLLPWERYCSGDVVAMVTGRSGDVVFMVTVLFRVCCHHGKGGRQSSHMPWVSSLHRQVASLQ